MNFRSIWESLLTILGNDSRTIAEWETTCYGGGGEG